jgi:hypothetical protein
MPAEKNSILDLSKPSKSLGTTCKIQLFANIDSDAISSIFDTPADSTLAKSGNAINKYCRRRLPPTGYLFSPSPPLRTHPTSNIGTCRCKKNMQRETAGLDRTLISAITNFARLLGSSLSPFSSKTNTNY